MRVCAARPTRGEPHSRVLRHAIGLEHGAQAPDLVIHLRTPPCAEEVWSRSRQVDQALGTESDRTPEREQDCSEHRSRVLVVLVVFFQGASGSGLLVVAHAWLSVPR